jgi:hypothetical protein
VTATNTLGIQLSPGQPELLSPQEELGLQEEKPPVRATLMEPGFGARFFVCFCFVGSTGV